MSAAYSATLPSPDPFFLNYIRLDRLCPLSQKEKHRNHELTEERARKRERVILQRTIPVIDLSIMPTFLDGKRERKVSKE